MPVIITIPNAGLFFAGLVLLTVYAGCMCVYWYIRYRIERKRQAARLAEFYRTHEFHPGVGRIVKVRD